MIRAWVLQFMWRFDLQAQVLLQVDELLQTGAADLLSADSLQLLRAQMLLMRAQQALFRQPAHAVDRFLPAGTDSTCPFVDIRARRSDAFPGFIHASQRPGTGSRTLAAR